MLPGWKAFVYPAVIIASGLALSGCASINHVLYADGEAPIVQGPPARDNVTPLASAYSCMADRMRGRQPIGIAVGNIRDYTGRTSDSEGMAITQGGALMVISALGKLGPAVRMHERFDTQVSEIELAHIDRRRLGDGETHEVEGQEVPWMPYFGGTILKSDFFIVGGITELNYNIQSGGVQFSVNLVGPKARTYTMNIAADLRIVDTESLVVVKTVSLQKQIVGYEVGAGIFRFFNTNLVDLHTGAKNQEPLHLGVRTVLELGVLDLISSVSDVNHVPCLSDEARAVAEQAVYK
jgi:curli biogenesis system outer membrane secretion channel CsgG